MSSTLNAALIVKDGFTASAHTGYAGDQAHVALDGLLTVIFVGTDPIADAEAASKIANAFSEIAAYYATVAEASRALSTPAT